MLDLTTTLNQRIESYVKAALAQSRSGAQNAGAFDAVIPGWLAEVARQAFVAKGTSGKRVQGKAVGLLATLGTAAATGSDDFSVPQGYDFEINAIRGMIGVPSGVSLASEAAVDTELSLGAAATNLTPRERLYMAAAMCRIGLTVDGASLPIFENESPYLATLLERDLIFGGNFPRLVIPSQSKLAMTATLQDTTAAIAGVNKSYGLLLIGTYISCDT